MSPIIENQDDIRTVIEHRRYLPAHLEPAALDGKYVGPAASAAAIAAAVAPKLDTSVAAATYATPANITAAVAPKLDTTVAAATYAPKLSGGKGIPRVYNPMDAPWNAVGDGTTDDTAAVQAMLDAIPDNSTVVFPGRHKVTSVTVDKLYVTVTGPGTIVGKLRIGTTGTRRDLFTNINGLTFDGEAAYATGVRASGVIGVELLKARAVNIKNCTFLNHDKAIYVNPLTDAVAHDTGMVNITGNNFSGVNYALYVDRYTSATWMHFSDSKFNNNIVNVAHIAHVWIKSVDGMHITGNTFFFTSFNSSDTSALQTKTQNIYMGQSNFVVISENNLFEAGSEAILLDQPSRFTIVGNNIAWPGQKVASDGIKLTGANTLNGVISSNMISKMTKDGISVYATGTGTVSIKSNSVEYDSATTTYYGTPALNTFTHYGVYQDAASTTINMFEQGNDQTGGLYTNRRGSLMSSVRLTNDSGVTASKAAITFTASTAAHVFKLNSQRYGQLTFSGLVEVEVKSSDTESGNLAVYLLQLSKTNVYAITQINSQGLTAGSSANWPSFTFTIDAATGDLVATPVGSTTGTFYFFTTGMGNIRLLSAT